MFEFEALIIFIVVIVSLAFAQQSHRGPRRILEV